MSLFLAEKVISTVPENITPDTVYFVRVGVGFDLYVSDSTGTVAHKLNVSSQNTNVAIDDFFSTDNLTQIAGNVLLNDNGATTVLFVNGSAELVGESVTGSNGGNFTISSTGIFVFTPNGMEPGDTRITYTSTTGSANGTAILEISVSESALITGSRLFYGEVIVYCGDKQLFVTSNT